MDPVLDEVHERYFYGYRVLYKNLEEPGSTWRQSLRRKNVVPIIGWTGSLIPYTNYSIRVMAASFQSEGLISEAFQVKTDEWGKWND